MNEPIIVVCPICKATKLANQECPVCGRTSQKWTKPNIRMPDKCREGCSCGECSKQAYRLNGLLANSPEGGKLIRSCVKYFQELFAVNDDGGVLEYICEDAGITMELAKEIMVDLLVEIKGDGTNGNG